MLYNGIKLPEPWPPRYSVVPSREPMPVPYLHNIPQVIPIDVGHQLFVDDFLIEPTELRRTHHPAEYYPENPVLKAIAGVPISTEGKTSACAHSDLCGNVMAAVCDLWANEAVEYHRMFGGSTPAVFVEMLGYDAAAMNAALALGYQKEFQACLVNSDRYRDPQSFILCPDNAWAIGRAVVENSTSLYSRARAAALKCSELLLGDPLLRFTSFEKDSLLGYVKELESLPAEEGDFIDLCLGRYERVKGFRPQAYGF